ncbi:MAG: hypothetical protein J2O48_00215 [Solirubrobacterales bacterium]|nr:hypothetical protein [Solirubrobacterales bacterium]
MSTLSPSAAIINEDRYPLSEPDSPGYADVVTAIRRQLRASGCSVLADFVAPDKLDLFTEAGVGVAPWAHHGTETVNVYNTAPDPSLPAEHPAHVALRRGNAFVARDLIPEDSVVQSLYTNRAFQRFLADCFELPEIHELADPLSALVFNVLEPGNAHPWHFDTNEFTVSMLTQAPEAGGEFQFCPGIRSPQSENQSAVADVLAGRAPHLVRRMRPRIGDLQLFRGRYSLHRVTTVEGHQERHTAIFAYASAPGVVGTPTRTRQLFGRLSDLHRGDEASSDGLAG